MNTIDKQKSNTEHQRERIALVTGTLAEPSLREVADSIAADGTIEPYIIVLNIQVAALMTSQWVVRKLALPTGRRFDRVIIPGYCEGDITPIARKLGLTVERGPTDLHDLPDLFVPGRQRRAAYGSFSIQIIAEINHAPQIPLPTLIQEAEQLQADGADLIDIGCEPLTDRPAWSGVGDAVRALRERDLHVSIDSFHPAEVQAACAEGAELVLSVDSTNRDAAADWGAEVVAIPDNPHTLAGLDETVAHLERHHVPYRIDPVIEPIGFGFAQSLGRYLQVRRHYPEAAMMMGIGNVTEMTEADAAGINMVLIGFCQELKIDSVLTTQVINWARSSVREIDVARRVMHYAVTHRAIPKHVDERLVMLRDPKLRMPAEKALVQLASAITDSNIRIFADPNRGRLHAMNQRIHAVDDDPFVLFKQLGIADASHAFYLGYEMAKAVTALTLGKNYTQDEPLNWGILTRPEASHDDRQKGH